MALLPLWGNYSSLIYRCPADVSKDLEDLSDEAFVDRVNHALHDNADTMLGGCIPDMFKKNKFEKPPLITQVVSGRHAKPLSLVQSNQYASHKMALIGKAAHRVHPLTG